jgi:hypothetical protein
LLEQRHHGHHGRLVDAAPPAPQPLQPPHASPWLHGRRPLFVGAIALVLLNQVPPRSLIAAAVSGLMPGYGARLAYGCNIGACFNGILSGSLHG